MAVSQDVSTMNFRALLENAAQKWGDRYALIFDNTGEKITFKEMYEQTGKISSVFHHLGIQKNDKIGLMLPNIPKFPLTWLSIGSIGAVMVPINFTYQSYDAGYILDHSEARLVVTTSEKVDMLYNIRQENRLSYKIMTVDAPNDLGDYYFLDVMQSLSTYQFPKTPVFSDSVVNIQYTSGTTGRPKGCMLSHYYWMNIGIKASQASFFGLDENDILLTAQPYYYIDPQWNTIVSLVTGATLVVLERFRPSLFWEKVREYHVTFFYCLGSMPALLLKMPESEVERNHSVRFVGCSAIPPTLHHQLETRWGVKWFEIFGMTETGYDLTMTTEEHDQYIGTGALGRPAFGREARVVDDHDLSVDRGKVGELVIRGIGMMDGYYKNEEATKEVFRNGWFHTGDLVRVDENGMFYYVGRKKDMIRRGGENISAVEVEEAIMTHECVNLAACISVDDELRGEEVKVYIVSSEPVPDKDEYVQNIIQYCEQKLASFKIPRYWELKDSLPLTPSERIAKHVLKQEKEDLRMESYDRIDQMWRY
ncbi:acyl-CoA synthetase [Brevibacillus fluminis]|uniref:Acyl-CoA synthetase n=1 Tax=Brevibacillus fluminis TaxID=511487 RepID=A0A3M8CVH6_9BACL|nr:AMP-binding protein [Brevibacillus fluminis]RNB79744.1 acyl-CoA synthetase [Brevibacillus fluminis]